MEGKADKGIFFKIKQVKMMLSLAEPNQRWYISNLAKAADTTYVNASKFVSLCEYLEIIKSEKHGKIKTLLLTEKGMHIAKNLNDIMSSLGKKEVQPPEVHTESPKPQ